MKDNKGKSLLNDIGTEELGHVEMLETMIYQLMKDLTLEEIKEVGLDAHYEEHAKALFPTDTNGVLFTVTYFGNNRRAFRRNAAEQNEWAVYENLIDLTDDQDIIRPLLMLRQRKNSWLCWIQRIIWLVWKEFFEILRLNVFMTNKEFNI